jgi:hypothetical protein
MAIDIKTSSPIAIDFIHHKVHDKQMLRCTAIFTATADSAASEMIIDATSTTECHAIVAAKGDGAIQAEILSVTAVTTVGTALSVANFYAGGDNTSTTKFYKTPTAATGTIWHKTYTPGGAKRSLVGGTARSEAEFVFEDSQFLLRVWNLAGTVSTMVIELEFYELPS